MLVFVLWVNEWINGLGLDLIWGGGKVGFFKKWIE